MPSTLQPYIGPAAGVATSILWTITSLMFTAAGRRLGATTMNAARIGMAIVLLAVTHRLLHSTWWPDAAGGQVLYLALSGIVGLALGDQALFIAFVLIGPRLAMLCMTLAPLMATVFGWFILGEQLTPLACVGIVVTVAGVAWAVLERPRAQAPVAQPGVRLTGVVLAIIGAACQAGGLLLSKQGIGHGWLPETQHLDPQAATLVRMTFAGVGMLPLLVWHRWLLQWRQARGRPPLRSGSRATGWLFTAGAAVLGPFLGVWMSLVAIDRAPLGIGQTLCSLTPVFILPFAAWVYKEHVSPRAILGALLAVAGSAVLFLPA